ncbi:MAG: 3-methyl-2-oxobutanoate dehydrogenase subunit VorB [Bacteroidales bacterium]|jgi:2-oxoglutarate ferredoxin oxidoreductase subunit alpha|nr:3-methyl-2-oxobutanoate dehydrogenase subunit VorB [Bacteroidales bacterium]
MAKELKLMKGNEAIAEAAIRSGCDGYFGYPITPQSEVMEYLMAEKPWEKTGMVVLQAESETSSINMVYGGAGAGKKVMTSSSSPGISLMQEGLTYLAGAELPCLVVNVVRGGPGLGTIQPSQADYFQATKGGGHGDYQLFVLAPATVQEMYDFVFLAWEVAFKYRNPVMILSDGAIGQVMEKLYVGDYVPRWTKEEIMKISPWATFGKPDYRDHNIITSLELDSAKQEIHNHKLQAKYREMEEKEVRYEAIECDDADYVFVAYGSSARIAQKALQLGREKGIKVGLLRPITLFPFPKKPIAELSKRVKGLLSVEMSAGQMVEDVRLAAEFRCPVEHFGRYGGMIPTPHEVLEALEKQIINRK